MSSGEQWRVAKRLKPGQPGTLKLARRYGDALLYVRYRHDEQRAERCTTVELVIDRALRAMLHQAGAQWDRQAGVWRLPYQLAQALNIKHRVVQK